MLVEMTRVLGVRCGRMEEVKERWRLRSIYCKRRGGRARFLAEPAPSWSAMRLQRGVKGSSESDAEEPKPTATGDAVQRSSCHTCAQCPRTTKPQGDTASTGVVPKRHVQSRRAPGDRTASTGSESKGGNESSGRAVSSERRGSAPPSQNQSNSHQLTGREEGAGTVQGARKRAPSKLCLLPWLVVLVDEAGIQGGSCDRSSKLSILAWAGTGLCCTKT